MITTNSHYFICFFLFKFDSFSSSYTDFIVFTGLILGITTTTAQWWRWHRTVKRASAHQGNHAVMAVTVNATVTNTRTTNGFVFSPLFFVFFINQIYFKCFKTLRPSDSSCENHDGDDERPPPQNTDGELEQGSRFVFAFSFVNQIYFRLFITLRPRMQECAFYKIITKSFVFISTTTTIWKVCSNDNE